MAPTAAELGARPAKILTERVVEQFFLRVLSEDRQLSSLTIVSPWVSQWESGEASLDKLGRVLEIRKVNTLVLTRPPEYDWHAEALERLNRARYTQIRVIPDLHAKVFLAEVIPAGFGLVGSANLTQHSLKNLEIGVMFDGRGMFSHLLRDLKTLAWQDLRGFSRPLVKD